MSRPLSKGVKVDWSFGAFLAFLAGGSLAAGVPGASTNAGVAGDVGVGVTDVDPSAGRLKGLAGGGIFLISKHKQWFKMQS